MRILCVCAGGNTRSVTLATLLKYNYGGHDALAASAEKNDPITLRMLYEWANLVIAVDKEVYLCMEELEEKVAPAQTKKVILLDIGQDKWGMSMHPDLIPIACKLLEAHGFKSKKQWDEIVVAREKYDLRRKEDG